MPLHKPADTVKTEALESSIVLLTRMCLLLENSGSIPKLAFGATRQCNANLQMQMQKCNAICNCNCNSHRTVISTWFISLSKGPPMNVLKTALVGEKQSKCIAQKVNCAMSNLAMPRSSTEDGNPNHFSKGLLRFGHRFFVRPTLSLPP